MLPTSETIKPFNMSSRCSAVDNMGMVNRDVEADDELKSCSCSFCLKGFCLIDYSVLLLLIVAICFSLTIVNLVCECNEMFQLHISGQIFTTRISKVGKSSHYTPKLGVDL